MSTNHNTKQGVVNYLLFIFRKRNKKNVFSEELQGNIDARRKRKATKNNAKDAFLYAITLLSYTKINAFTLQ